MPFTQTPLRDCDLSDTFFDSLRDDYPEFDSWFRRKADSGCHAYVDKDDDGSIHAFVMIKQEIETEELGNDPVLPPLPRLKISTLKIDDSFSGRRLGEGAMGVALWLWGNSEARQIYVTTFDKQKGLIDLLTLFGFRNATRMGNGELVFLRDKEDIDYTTPRSSFPFVNPDYPKAKYLPIKDVYHDRMFQYSEVRGVAKEESDLPVSNGITKMYIATPSGEIDYSEGDFVFIYRMYTGNESKAFKSAVTSYCTVGRVTVVKRYWKKLMSFREYRGLLGNKTVYTDREVDGIFDKEPNITLIELIYNGYFGSGNNVNLKTLRENGLWEENVHPYNSSLSKDQVERLLKLGKKDV